MVQDDGQVGHRLGELGQLRHLREVHPAFQGKAHAGEDAGTGAEVVAGHLVGHTVRGGVLDLGVRIPGDRMADAAEPVGAGRLEGLQYRLDAVSEVQVGVADDGCRSAARAVQSIGRSRRQALHELYLAHRTHLLGSRCTVH